MTRTPWTQLAVEVGQDVVGGVAGGPILRPDVVPGAVGAVEHGEHVADQNLLVLDLVQVALDPDRGGKPCRRSR